MRFTLSAIFCLVIGVPGFAANYKSGDYLVKLKSTAQQDSQLLQYFAREGVRAEALPTGNWLHIQVPKKLQRKFSLRNLARSNEVAYAQPNYKLGLSNTFRVSDPSYQAELADQLHNQNFGPFDPPPPDNPAIAKPSAGGSGADPLLSKQWGMLDIGGSQAWRTERGQRSVIVAVIDTGVDYNHEDLIDNMWRNPGETGLDAQGRDKATNGVDDDNNGLVDDVVGWDFASNDNKPYDFTTSIWDMLTGGGNPGHGTHCSGNVGARGDNGKGISGVAPNIRIMALRFLTEKGQGTTADAVKAIHYAIANGAKVLSNSWGSEGEDAGDPDNKALRDTIGDCEKAGVLFIAAAGNGHNGVGYDNDTDAKPGYPASYSDDIIVSVAAVDSKGALGSFSNWGRTTVDIGAPGVAVFSTIPTSDKYQDVVADLSIFGMQKVMWDGTSMATPHVAGAAALYWSKNPTKTWREVKAALLASAKPTPALSGKSVSGGRLDIDGLINRY